MNSFYKPNTYERQNTMALSFTQRTGKPRIEKIGGEPTDIFVYIKPEALDKMWHYVNLATKEIGWLGKVTRVKDEEENDTYNFIIDDVYLFTQTVTAVETVIDDEALGNFCSEIMTSYDDKDEAMEVINHIKLWGHSHVNMGVSPSGTDNTTMDNFGETVSDYMIRIIANKSGELKIDIYFYDEKFKAIDVPWSPIQTHIIDSESIKNEIAEKITERTYQYSSFGNNRSGYSGYYSRFNNYAYNSNSQNSHYGLDVDENDIEPFYYNNVYGAHYYNDEGDGVVTEKDLKQARDANARKKMKRANNKSTLSRKVIVNKNGYRETIFVPDSEEDK